MLLAPSERAVVDVLFDTPGQVRLEHRTPDRVYDLGAFTVTDGAAPQLARDVRGAAHRPGAHGRATSGSPPTSAAPDKVLAFVSQMPLLDGPADAPARIVLRLPDASRGDERRAGHLPEVRHEAACRRAAAADRLRLPDAPRGDQRGARHAARSAG